jgi:hypothetical protein
MTARLRILMLNNEYPPLGGGTGVVNYHLLKELSAYSNIWVDLVTSSRNRSTHETEQFSERITIYKVPVNNRNIHHSSNRELLSYTRRGLQLGRSLQKMALLMTLGTALLGAILEVSDVGRQYLRAGKSKK